MTAPREIRLVMLVRDALLQRRGLRRMLTALVRADVAPTHAGMREQPKDAFVLDAFVDRVARYASTSSMPSFVRRAKPAYVGFFNPQRTELSMLDITFRGDPGEAPYAAADALAAAMHVELGLVHPIVDGAGRAWNSAAFTTADHFRRLGIEGICARMYLGPHVVRLVGKKRLAEAGARLVKRGAVLELAPRPWTVELDTLERLQRKVTPIFEAAGVIGHEIGNVRGARWKPLRVV